MDKKNNIYNYKPTKEMNEEVHFFYYKGRISIKVFLLRIIFITTIYVISFLTFEYYFLEKYWYWYDLGNGMIRNNAFLSFFNFYEQFHDYYLPIFLTLFLILQGIKRIHDTNNTGWYIFMPLYNIILLFSAGTKENNQYGLTPYKTKNVKFFDELEGKNTKNHEKAGNN